MGVVFERFTERARQVVVLAQEEARRLKHNYIGTEHLLLGLLREEEGVAARVLGGLGVELEATRAAILKIVGSGEEVTSGQIPFTPRAKRVMELSLREALSLGHDYIGTEHVLLGLARENEGVAARVLLDADVDAERLRTHVAALSTPGAQAETRELFEDQLAKVEGLLSAWERRAEVFGLTAEAADQFEATRRVAERLGIPDGMALRVLDLRLADMTHADGTRLREQRDELRKRLGADEG